MGNFDNNRFKSTNQTWETPGSLFNKLNEEFLLHETYVLLLIILSVKPFGQKKILV